jgi:hypothetical protein
MWIGPIYSLASTVMSYPCPNGRLCNMDQHSSQGPIVPGEASESDLLNGIDRAGALTNITC